MPWSWELISGKSWKEQWRLRDRIARSKFIHEDQLEKIQALSQTIEETLHQILAQGGLDNERH